MDLVYKKILGWMIVLTFWALVLWTAIVLQDWLSVRLHGQASPTVSTILIDGKQIDATTLNLISGPSILWLCQPVGTSQLNCQTQANTATLVTKNVLQSGACTFLNSTNGTSGYTVSLGSTCQTLANYTAGQRWWLKTDAKCPASCSLNIDNVGPRNIKRSDGTTDPGGLFDFTKGVPVWFDGLVFRIEWQNP